MPGKLSRDSIESEIVGINSLLNSLEAGDVVGKASLEYRRRELATELDRLVHQISTLGMVTLAFEGGPVTGSRGIDAEFASNALHDYQELIAKQMAAVDTGGLARSGPVPAKGLAKLNITDLMHGSFGFHLEERDSDEPQMIDSPVKKAIEKVDEILIAFSSNDEDAFNRALAIVDRRVFITLQSFYENLYRDSASLKIFEDERSFIIDQYAVLTARERIHGVEVGDEEFTMEGELLGLTPISRRFDFQPSDRGAVLSGQVGQRLSDDYLERLHGEERISGRVYKALLSRRTATRVDGSISVSYTLVDLGDPGNQLEDHT